MSFVISLISTVIMEPDVICYQLLLWSLMSFVISLISIVIMEPSVICY